jgi:branched-chain amino acid transport system substrate-binding protein
MKNRKKLVFCASVVSILFFCALIFLAASSRDAGAAAPAAKTLKIGALMSVTGWFTPHDGPDSHEIQMAADMINEKGGIDVKGEKYQIEIVLEDGKSTLDGVASAANRLVFDKGVKFIIGPAAFFSAAVTPITTPNKVINVLSFSTNQPGECDKNTPYAFVGYNASVGEALAGMKFFNKHYPKVKKLAFVIPDDGAIASLTPILKKLFAQHGLSIVGDPIGYSNETTDFNPIAAKINALKDADAVFQQNGIAPHIAGIVKGLRNLGNKKPYGGIIPSRLDDVVAVAGKDAAKDVFMCGATPMDPGNTPLMNEMGKRIAAKYGKDESIYLQGATAFWVLVQAIEAAQSLDPTVVKAKWETMNNVETFQGMGRMCGTETYGLKNHAVSHPQPFQMMKDGKVVNAGFVDPGVIP